MSLTYSKLLKKPRSLQRLLGVDKEAFTLIVTHLTPIWISYQQKRYIRSGRNYKHHLGGMIALLLIYYRSYITQEFVGYIFNLDKSNVCRIIKQLEPLLAKILPIPKRRVLTQEEVTSLIIDVTEQPIERPKKGQKDYYSGKKKQHTLKTEIRIDQNGKIVQLSKSYPGKLHDFSIFKIEPPPPDGIELLADSGYQGIDKLYQMSCIPFKGSKNNPLCKHKKIYNQALSSKRALVEHKIGAIKIFKIIGNRYRNKRERYNLKFKIVAGLVNFKGGHQLKNRVA